MSETQRQAAPAEGVPLLASVGKLLARALLVLLTAITLVSLMARDHWFADLLANLRVQQVIAIVIALVISLGLRKWLAASLLLVLLAVHVPWFVQPRASTSEAGDPVTVTLANAFVHNVRFDDVVTDLVRRDPDVFVAMEMTHGLAARIHQRVGDQYPYFIERPRDYGSFGIGMYSKYPLQDGEVFDFDRGIESITATVVIREQPLRLYATHPPPPMEPGRFQWRNDHLSKLATRISMDRARSPDVPIVLVGDFNLTPWSPLFQDLKRDSGLVRACQGVGLAPTWYALPTFAFGLALDHGLISDHLSCVGHEVGSYTGSDHRSVTLWLQMEG